MRVKRNEEFQESKEMMCKRSTVQLLSAANGINSWHYAYLYTYSTAQLCWQLSEFREDIKIREKQN